MNPKSVRRYTNLLHAGIDLTVNEGSPLLYLFNQNRASTFAFDADTHRLGQVQTDSQLLQSQGEQRGQAQEATPPKLTHHPD